MSDKEMSDQGCAKAKCANCKRGIEHLSTVLPFSVLEKITDTPLKIKGVAMTTGLSRNSNIYTAEELASFADKLVGVPVYVEHVSVPNAIGKVTSTDWGGRALWYEAEIYEGQTAEKIRKGLIRHVSVAADYEAVDLIDGRIRYRRQKSSCEKSASSGGCFGWVLIVVFVWIFCAVVMLDVLGGLVEFWSLVYFCCGVAFDSNLYFV